MKKLRTMLQSDILEILQLCPDKFFYTTINKIDLAEPPYILNFRFINLKMLVENGKTKLHFKIVILIICYCNP